MTDQADLIYERLLVVRAQAGVFTHVHGERGNVTVDAEFPVFVLVGRGFESDRRQSGGLFHERSLLRI